MSSTKLDIFVVIIGIAAITSMLIFHMKELTRQSEETQLLKESCRLACLPSPYEPVGIHDQCVCKEGIAK